VAIKASRIKMAQIDCKIEYDQENIVFYIIYLQINSVSDLKGEHWLKNTFYGRLDWYLSKISAMEIIHLNASFRKMHPVLLHPGL
jgi:hypothetical protein